MTRPSGNLRGTVIAVAAVAAVAASLAGSACVHLPRLQLPAVEHQSLLVPVAPGDDYVVGDGGVVSFHGLEGARLDVQYLSDAALNELFPDDSRGGERSTNPYTYGDWVDPNLGYTPNRFTVFRVTVHNYTHARILLDPRRAILLTDRGGYLQSYAVSPGGDRHSLEGYYRVLRGISGNEHYRFAKRIGIVRSSIYGEEEMVFKGESYSGLMVFPPLHQEVRRARLILKDVAYRFDAGHRPLAALDVSFDGRREIVHEVRERMAAAAGPAPTTRLVLKGPLEMSGNIPGDLARDAASINAAVDRHRAGLNRCFQAEYDRGLAVEGQVEVAFVLRVNGVVETATVVGSDVVSDAVGECVAADVKRWVFEPAGKFAPAEAEDALPGEERLRPAPPRRAGPTLTSVRVVYPFAFEAIPGSPTEAP